MAKSTRGFGVAGEYSLATIRAAAQAAESSGYGSFWLSQPPDRDSLVTLADVGRSTRAIALGIGAIPLTARTPLRIAERVREQELPLERLWLGVGSGTDRGALDRVRAGVRVLRSLLAVEIVVAPLGPKMCRVAGEVADAVLLNWLTPEYAQISREWIQEGAMAADREPPKVYTYVRCALGPASLPRLEQDCARYGTMPHYAAHFQRQGVEPMQTAILAYNAAELQERLSAYDAVLDAVIVRAITPNDAIDEARALVEAAAPVL